MTTRPDECVNLPLRDGPGTSGTRHPSRER
jgi:hypothetical protein